MNLTGISASSLANSFDARICFASPPRVMNVNCDTARFGNHGRLCGASSVGNAKVSRYSTYALPQTGMRKKKRGSTGIGELFDILLFRLSARVSDYLSPPTVRTTTASPTGYFRSRPEYQAPRAIGPLPTLDASGQ